jgi:hypothetical protein
MEVYSWNALGFLSGQAEYIVVLYTIFPGLFNLWDVSDLILRERQRTILYDGKHSMILLIKNVSGYRLIPGF